MEDEEIKDISVYKRSKKYPKWASKNESFKRNFRRKCEKFHVDKDNLFFKSKSGPLKVLRKTEVPIVLKSIHQEMGGHLGVNKTWKKVRERYYWRGSFREVRDLIRQCDRCQRKGVLKKAKKPLRPISVPENAFSQIGMDIIGPLEETKKGNRFLLVFTDYLTKWCEVDPLPKKSADQVNGCFINFVSRHGVPDVLITDQGREFCNDLNKMFCEVMGIDHRVASPYHPQTGGLTERFNRTLCTMLVTMVNSEQDDWDVQLPYALFAYRTAEQKSTKSDPFSLVYGRKAKLPVELKIPTLSADTSEDEALNLRTDAFVRLKTSRKAAAENIHCAQKKQKRYHDDKIDKDIYQPGDLVMLHNTRRLTRKGGKLQQRWTGPYHIKHVMRNGNYKLEGVASSVNGNRLKRYRNSSVPSPPTDTSSKQELPKHFTPTDPSKQTESGMKRCRSTTAPSVHYTFACTVEDVSDDSNTPGCSTKDTETCVKSPSVSASCRDDATTHTRPMNLPPESEDVDDVERDMAAVQSDDKHLPFKKRKISNSEDVFLTRTVERTPTISFHPVDKLWQQEKSSYFGISVKNPMTSESEREIDISAKPIKTVSMRGDGNCLFRALSYVVFGVQTYHGVVRDYILDFMAHNANLMKKIESRPVNTYIAESGMSMLGTWGSDIEIAAFATMLQTNIYVYSQCGEKEKQPVFRWLKYQPLLDDSQLSERSIYLTNQCAHFEPVLMVEAKSAPTEYIKEPYFGVRNYIPKRYHDYFSEKTLDAVICDNYIDAARVEEMNISDTVYIFKFTSSYYNIPGTERHRGEMEATIFNLLCDWEDFPRKLCCMD